MTTNVGRLWTDEKKNRLPILHCITISKNKVKFPWFKDYHYSNRGGGGCSAGTVANLAHFTLDLEYWLQI